MKAVLTLPLYCAAGTMLTLLSTLVGERSALAVYPEIMGCESGCAVVATGWPLMFVRDYLGMSVLHTADIMEVWFAADRFDWPPFLINAVFWSLALLAAHAGLRRWQAARR